MNQTNGRTLVKGMGMISAVALIVGNMVGTGIYTLPASLANEAGPLSIVSWILTAAGYLFLAIIYADMGSAYPQSGGPSVYARKAFGDFVGFEIAFSYWLSVIIGNAAIVIATVGYLSVFNETLKNSPPLQVVMCLFLIWILVGINITGVKQGAAVTVVATAAKLIPLLIFSIVAIWYFDPGNFTPFAPHSPDTGSIITAISAGAALTVWAFAGLESATVPAEEVDNPNAIRKSTMIGFGITTVVYLLISISVTGILSNDEIAQSASPLALAATRILGSWGGTFMAVGALISGLGTLNGWILLSGRIPLGVAADGLFPKALAHIHVKYHTPYVSLIIAGVIASLLVSLRLSRTLLDTFEFIVLLSVLMTLIPHVTTTYGEYVMSKRDPSAFPPRRAGLTPVISITGLIFVIWIIYGTGLESIGLGGTLLIAGIPLYYWRKRTV
ncbi:MAG: amino acid permease [Gemmatimonadota bacterium]|nr:amino acid permease [Gemmatimonadota bacterium]